MPIPERVVRGRSRAGESHIREGPTRERDDKILKEPEPDEPRRRSQTSTQSEEQLPVEKQTTSSR